MSDTPLTYEEEIAYTQKIRKQIIQKKIEEGIPKDNDELKVLLSALKDHDTTTLSDRKNRIDESTSKSSAEIAQAMSELIAMNQNRNPFARGVDGAPVDSDHAPKALLPQLDESKLGEHTLVDGEEEVGVVQEDSESFYRRMGVDLNKKRE